MLPVSMKLGMAVQLFVFLGILVSTVTITRSVVQGTLPVINKGMEHLQEKGDFESFTPPPVDDIVEYTQLQGYIVSNRERRYNNSKKVLDKLGIQAHQYVPLSYKSQQIYDAMISYHNGSTKYHTDTYKKVFSNRMAFTDLFQKFVEDRRAGSDSWRFFFEDDVQLHPDLNDRLAQKVLANGMKVAAGDGIMYLGICGPRDCQDRTKLSSHIEASRCWGACTHAFALTKWKTGGFLSYMDQLKTPHDVNITSMYFDQLMRTYGTQVHKIWVLGSNLKSLQVHNHYGLVFQDRTHFPSVINSGKKSENLRQASTPLVGKFWFNSSRLFYGRTIIPQLWLSRISMSHRLIRQILSYTDSIKRLHYNKLHPELLLDTSQAMLVTKACHIRRAEGDSPTRPFAAIQPKLCHTG